MYEAIIQDEVAAGRHSLQQTASIGIPSTISPAAYEQVNTPTCSPAGTRTRLRRPRLGAPPVAGGDDTVYVGLINTGTMQHAGTMNMLSIMSGDPYRWTVK